MTAGADTPGGTPGATAGPADPGGTGSADGQPSGTGILTSTRDRDDLRRRLQRWLQGAAPGTTVTAMAAPEGNGASSDTVLTTVEGGPVDAGLPGHWAVRIAPPPGSMAQFPRYDMALQAAAMVLVGAGGAAPVPRVLFVETDPGPLGAPFLVMEAVEGRVPPDVMPYPFGSWLSEAPVADQRRLQDGAVETLAAIHDVPLSPEDRRRFGGPGPGATALRRHLAATGEYYRWVSADGIRSPLLERSLAWLDEHCPDDDGEVLSWGDSRIGNMLFAGWDPAAVLDWEMVGTGPREIDLGWMVFCHWWFQDMAVAFGLPGMPGFMRPEDAAATYERASGHVPRHLEFHMLYAAVRLGIVMSRMARRQVAIGEVVMPDDPDDTVMHRTTIEEMLAGRYWPRP